MPHLFNFRLFLTASLLLIGTIAESSSASPAYVGLDSCKQCHQKQVNAWKDSHHDLAMQEVTEETVLGDFNNASTNHFGITSSFYRDGDRFMVKTEGANGKQETFEIKYVFGVTPLQQYLIEFPGGRLQALSLAWDTRPKTEGGQRWFHLYPDEHIKHTDELHWTKPSQNWNSMCAECHSTRLEKNYNEQTDSFNTTWSEIDVSCEACHGPGSDHLKWARKQKDWQKLQDTMGLVLQLDERKDVNWTINPETGNAVRSKARATVKEIEMCARCHSRRSPISKNYKHGDRLTDHYRPRLLDEAMYFADGQIRDEAYVYGSFLQSKMYQAGVTCSDCHEPHRAEPKIKGNGICLQCHQASKYDNPDHHFHKLDQAGSSCVECHMPPRNYMVVDARHDHSMRIPRPDLSQTLGTPNACNTCHTDKDTQWAASHFKKWYPKPADGHRLYGEQLATSRSGADNTGDLLASLVRAPAAPGIIRATALSSITPYLGRESVDTLQTGVASDDPLMRMAAIDVLQELPATTSAPLAFHLLSDPVRAVRIEAALALASIAPGQLSDEQSNILNKAMQEYIDSQQAMAERPEAQTNLGYVYASLGDFTRADAAYNKAIKLNPSFVPAYLNYADFKRSAGDEIAVQQVLKQGLELSPGQADLLHALGLSLVRQQRLKESIELLAKASRNAPDNARYLYIYAVALNSSGQEQKSLLVLQGAHNRFPNNRDILNALVSYNQALGNHDAVRIYSEKLKTLTR